MEHMDNPQISGDIEALEADLGRQVRKARIAADLDQRRLAARANVSIDAVSRLERGKGSSVRTLIAVLRALGRTDWLTSLAPPVAVSPMQLLRAKQAAPRERQRVRRARDAEPG